MSQLYALIMAGGSGTRLWPLSRRKSPKQLLSVVGNRTMFRITIERLMPLIPPERVFVVTNAEMAAMLQQQEPIVPTGNYVLEPTPKDSGPAAALGLAHIHHLDPDATVAILSSDHYIGRKEDFRRALQAASEVAQGGHIVTLGIAPTHPSTGFGYVEQGESLGTHYGYEVYRTVRFTEKPSSQIAEQWVADGRHSWNSGMFILSARTAWRELSRQQPAFETALRAAALAIGTPQYDETLGQAWDAAPRKSIDFAIMEGAERMAMIPVEIEWSDIGTWASLLEVLPADADGNVIIGDHLGVDTQHTLVRGGSRLIATIGLKDLVIVDTADALLICPLDRVQEVKMIVDQLRARQRTDVL